MKKVYFLFIVSGLLFFTKCNGDKLKMGKDEDFLYYTGEQFADIKVGRYQIPGFSELSLKQKEMLYYLYEAALSGRDIIFDQNYKFNLKIKRTLEAIVASYKGNRDTNEFRKFLVYTKSFWFSRGIHHHYSLDKILPEFSKEYFAELVNNSPDVKSHLIEDETVLELVDQLTPIIFDPDIIKKRIISNAEGDLIDESPINFYEGSTQKEVEKFYADKMAPNDPTPISYGLNSKLIKEDGIIKERVWKVGGMYSSAIEKIVYWLEKARELSENQRQRETFDLLIEFYKTGDLRIFDEYSIVWTKDTLSYIDFVNGFIETYEDPLNMRGSYESRVYFTDKQATHRAETISRNAQWFEDHSPIANEHKKKKARGVSAKVVTIVALGGDASPYPPLGVNLPNAPWIRKIHGSKSVTLGNISLAYFKIDEGTGVSEEFIYSEEDLKRAKKYGTLARFIHTDMHEIIGHGSGQINPGVDQPRETLKNYASAIEETRADLVAYYYAMDPKLVEIGVIPNLEVGMTAYERAIRNGFMQQLIRINLGDDIQQAHLRNRQIIAKWAYELGKNENVIEKKIKNGKTFFVVNDYQKLRIIFGQMLHEVQRITSEGDYEAAKILVETYGVKIDYQLHKEVMTRYEKLHIKPYIALINPVLKPVLENGKIIDVEVEYPIDFTEQMMFYARDYSFLPIIN